MRTIRTTPSPISTQPQAGTPLLEFEAVVVWWWTTVAPGFVFVSVFVWVLDSVVVEIDVFVWVEVSVLVFVVVDVVVVVVPVVFVLAALLAVASADAISAHRTIAAPTRGSRPMNLATDPATAVSFSARTAAEIIPNG
jgi:hypothetical protein